MTLLSETPTRTPARSKELERFLSEVEWNDLLSIGIKKGFKARVEDLLPPFEVRFRGYRPLRVGKPGEKTGIQLTVARPEEKRPCDDRVSEKGIRYIHNLQNGRMYII